MASGHNIKAGRSTAGESSTIVMSGRPDELDVPFNGTATLIAMARKDEQQPNLPVNGVLGEGWTGSELGVATKAGCGLLGFGGSHLGTGVIGLGGGARHKGPFVTWTEGEDGPAGSGGVGVFGHGGSTAELVPSHPTPVTLAMPGAGVVGRGGASKSVGNTFGHGPGVVGLAGDPDEASMPSPVEVENTGVYGRGGHGGAYEEAEPVGPSLPGPGILGRGGAMVSGRGAASGVVGVAGDAELPDRDRMGGCGVIGFAENGPGARGESRDLPGLWGVSQKSVGVRGEGLVERGGMFSSQARAQVGLVPLEVENPNGVVEGAAGDLLATIIRNGRETARLWFCVRTGEAATAVWVRLA